MKKRNENPSFQVTEVLVGSGLEIATVENNGHVVSNHPEVYYG